MDAFIHERMGKLPLLLDQKLENVDIKNDRNDTIVTSYCMLKNITCVWLSIIYKGR